MKKIIITATNEARTYQQWTEISSNAYHEQYNTCLRNLKEEIKAAGKDVSSFEFSEKIIEDGDKEL